MIELSNSQIRLDSDRYKWSSSQKLYSLLHCMFISIHVIPLNLKLSHYCCVKNLSLSLWIVVLIDFN